MAKKPGQPGYIRPNFQNPLAPGVELGNQPAGTPPQVTDAPSRSAGKKPGQPGYIRPNYQNPLAPGVQLGGPTAGPQRQSPSYSGTTVTAPPPPAPAPPPAPVDPRDSTYWANVNAEAQTIGNRIAGYQHQGDQARGTYDTTLAGYAKQEPLDVLAAQLAAGRTGGLYSTSLGQHLGQIGEGYTTKRGTALTTRDTALSNLADLITAAQDEQNTYNTGQYGEAVGRAATAAANNPALGEPVSTPAAPAATAPGAMAPASITTHVGGPFYHWYQQTYGAAPPLQVSPNSARYRAWQQGKTPAQAKSIPFGKVG
jgi:hypothetical protein